MIAFVVLQQIPPIPPIPPIPQIPPEIVTIATGGPPVGAIVAIVALLVAGVIVLPLVRAFARRLERGAKPDDGTLAELEHLRARVAELEQFQHRLAELEERVDFSERLLTQRTPEMLKRGDDQ